MNETLKPIFKDYIVEDILVNNKNGIYEINEVQSLNPNINAK